MEPTYLPQRANVRPISWRIIVFPFLLKNPDNFCLYLRYYLQRSSRRPSKSLSNALYISAYAVTYLCGILDWNIYTADVALHSPYYPPTGCRDELRSSWSRAAGSNQIAKSREEQWVSYYFLSLLYTQLSSILHSFFFCFGCCAVHNIYHQVAHSHPTGMVH
jgi:hypothetical protein